MIHDRICVLLVSVLNVTVIHGLSTIENPTSRNTRRHVLATSGNVFSHLIVFAPFIKEAHAQDMIASRFTADILSQPKVKQTSEFSLFRGTDGFYDDLFFPSWMAGEWEAYQTLSSFKVPLGKRYLSGPSGLQNDVAESTIQQQQALIGKTVGPFKLRFLVINTDTKQAVPVSTDDTIQERSKSVVVEDRLHNLRSRTNAFAGKDVVKSVEYVEVGGANSLNYGEAPLPTTLLRYKGPVVQKIFSNNRESEMSYDGEGSQIWTGFESTRTILARKDIDLPPVVSDIEIITQLKVPLLNNIKEGTFNGDGRETTQTVVHGRIRIAGYLNPNDALYFDAKQRAVTLSDYVLKLVKT